MQIIKYLPQKIQIISGSFAENDLQLKEFCGWDEYPTLLREPVSLSLQF